MSSITETSKGKLGLHALDPDLPLLASEAAIDIDNILSDKSTDLTAIHQLAEQLKNSIEVPTEDGQLHSLMDPATLTILSEAMSERSLHKVDELLGEAVKIAEVLSSVSNNDPMETPERLSEARDFCVAFSRAVMGYHKSIHDLRPAAHPSRR